MAVEIKSGNSSDLGIIDPISKALRVTNYNPNGSIVDTKTPISVTINPVTVVNNDIFASTDVSNYKYISLQLTGTWVGIVKFQGSNNNGTFEDIVVQNTGVVLSPYVLEMTSNGGVKIPVLFKYLRIRVTAYTSGSVTGTAYGYEEDANTGQISTVGTVNIGAAQTLETVTNVQKLGGQTVAMGGGVVSAGTQRVTVATDTPVVLGAGSAIIGKVSIASGSILIPLFVLGAAGAVNVNSASVATGARVLRTIVFTNYAATSRHFKIYDTASVPSAGVGTPVIVCSMAAAGTLSFPLPVEGFPFTNGIGYTMTLGAANNDVTPTATAPDFSVSLIYS
jgi:hypothetical protein